MNTTVKIYSQHTIYKTLAKIIFPNLYYLVEVLFSSWKFYKFLWWEQKESIKNMTFCYICIGRVSEVGKCYLYNKYIIISQLFYILSIKFRFTHTRTYREKITRIHSAKMHLNQKQSSYPDFAFSSSASTFMLRDSSIPVVSSFLSTRFSFSSVFFRLTSFSWSLCVDIDSNKFFLLP